MLLLRVSLAVAMLRPNASLADRKISYRYPVVVDCDHGTVQLSGVVASARDAKQATVLAQNIEGVVAVKNQLTWR